MMTMMGADSEQNPRARSCQNCVKAKSKCYGHTEGKCERCKRLNKDCTMQEFAGRKRKQTKVTRTAQAAQIAHLQEKVDGLVKLLGPGQLPSPSTGGPTPTQTPESAATTIDPQISGAEINVAGGGIVDPAELLQVYHKELAREVPFVVISTEITAQQLAQSKPFLYLVVIAVSSYHNTIRQKALGEEVIKYLSDHYIVRGVKNLDMLQGIIVFVTFYNKLFYVRPQLSMLLSLANTMMADLALNVAPLKFGNHEMFISEMRTIIARSGGSCTDATGATSLEDMRAVLGVFYIYACATYRFSKLDPLQWTPWMQTCLDMITNMPENKDDLYLIHLVKLQKISLNARFSPVWKIVATPGSSKCELISTHIKLLLSELAAFRDGLPEELKSDAAMLMGIIVTKIQLFDVGLLMPPISTEIHGDVLQQSDVLFMSLEEIQQFLDVYFALRPQYHICFTMINIGQIYSAISSLSKLSLFESKEWDATAARRKLDLSQVINQIVEMMDEASTLYDGNSDHGLWRSVGRRMMYSKAWYDKWTVADAPLGPATPSGPQTQTQTQTHSAPDRAPPPPPMFQAQMEPFSQFNLFDESFWETMPDFVP